MLSPAAKSQFTVELYSNVVLEMLGGKKNHLQSYKNL